MTSEKAKEQCVAVVQCVSIEEEMIKMRQCRGKCVFFFEQVYQEVHVSKSGCVATAHEKPDKKS